MHQMRSVSALPKHPPLRTFFHTVTLLLAAAATGIGLAHAQGTAGGSTTTQSPENAPAPGKQPSNAQQTLPNPAKLPDYEESKPLNTQRPASTTTASDALRAWQGLTVSSISFQGVGAERLNPLPAQLDLQTGQRLDALKIRTTLRRLYATGLYSTIEVTGTRDGDRVALTFQGKPQLFIGRVNVNGVSDENYTSLLQGATKLRPGTPYSDTKLNSGRTLIEKMLHSDGYYTAQIIVGRSVDPATQQMNISYTVTLGERARVGQVDIGTGSGLTEAQFRKISKLKPRTSVTRDTINTALDKLRAHYQKLQLLEAQAKLQSKTFVEPVNRVNYAFQIDQGHKVTVVVNGVKASRGRIRDLVPVYEEGTVDEDLLNEGNRRIRDFYQRQGYFDVQVSHTTTKRPDGETDILYNVQLGLLHDVDAVSIQGNHYFSDAIILPRLNVVARSFFDRHGLFSQALMSSDVSTIQAIYQGNGFSHVAVKPVVKDVEIVSKGKKSKVAHITVTYQITEGVQQRFGSYKLVGNVEVPDSTLTPLLNTEVGQPYDSENLTGDRAAVLTWYLAHGFDHAAVDLKQVPDPRDPNLIDATLEITEGEQIHVNQVLISGLHYTRYKTVAPYIHVRPGDVLDQSALINSQRELYDLTLFNGVNTAVQNPNGDELKKNVLLQFTEAKRWDVTYGVGFQAQTGNPGSCNVEQRIQEGLNPYGFCNQNGFGASGLVTLNVSRINLRGSDNSVSLRTTYGSLEKIAVLTYTDPHPFGKRALTFSVSGGYTNEQDVTTYAASRLEGTVRLTQRIGRPTTFIYDYAFRRVSVDADTVQVAPDQIPLLSQPVTVGGPGITWIRDTRQPSSLNASGGTYNTVVEFLSDAKFGSQANFNSIDYTNATYYPVGSAKKYVFARQTRIAFERAYGNGLQELIPLPERLYAGGAESHRGFAINAAGPRDPVTGFPIGGAAAFVNSFELRLPPPRLPYVGTSVSFVLFHDMGNVFVKGDDIWPSFLRFRQPDRAGCRDLSLTDQEAPNTENNSIGLTGRCSDNYFSHALGIGARYNTPIGPLRFDTSYNLNPPIYPEIEGYDLDNATAPAQVGEASHFNFFFSIGQAF